MRRPPRSGFAVCGIVATLLAGACRADGGSPSATTTSAPLTTTSSTTPPEAEPTVVTDRRRDTTDTASYDVAVPVLAGLADAEVRARVNATIEQWAGEVISGFLAGATAPPAGEPAGAVSTLTATYEVGVIGPRLLSLRLAADVAIASAATANTTVRTLNFDLRTGAQLALADLFEPGAPYLEELASLARSQISANFDDFGDPGAVADGTEPREENFDAWLLLPENLQVNFDQGQVAARAAGVVKVSIPYDDLEALAVGDGPISVLT